MNKKLCRGCELSKNTDEFYRHKGAKDGYRNLCIPCYKSQCKSYYSANSKSIKSRVSQYAIDNAEKIKAKGAVYTATKSGNMPRAGKLDCQRCAGRATEYHHWSYEKEHWLSVVPLCRSCHKIVHRDNIDIRPTTQQHGREIATGVWGNDGN